MSDALVKHAFVSQKVDGPDPTKIRASNWNAALLFSGGVLGDLLYRDTGSATGASYLPDVAAGSVLVSGGVGAAPAFTSSPALGGALTVSKESASESKNLLVFQTNESGAGDFYVGIGSVLNGFGSARYDQTLTWGYNQLPGASNRVLTTEHAMAWRMENYYTPNGSTQAGENHLVYINRAGASYRLFETYTDLNSDLTNINFNSSTFSVSNQATTQLLYVAADGGSGFPIVRVVGSTTRLQHDTNNLAWLTQKTAGGSYAALTYLDATDRLVVGGSGVTGLVFGFPVSLPNLAGSNTAGLVLENPTLATVGQVLQASPYLRLRSHVWNTTSVASNTNDWLIGGYPSSGAIPVGALQFVSSLNGGASTVPMSLTSAGNLTLLGAATLGGNLKFTSSAVMIPQGDGKLNWYDNPTSSGVGFDFKTNNIFKLRNTAQTGGAAFDLLEQTAPVGATNSVRLYAQDNGSGKTQLMAIFPTGTAVQIAIEA